MFSPGLRQVVIKSISSSFFRRRLIIADIEAVATHREALDIARAGKLGDVNVFRPAEGLAITGCCLRSIMRGQLSPEDGGDVHHGWTDGPCVAQGFVVVLLLYRKVIVIVVVHGQEIPRDIAGWLDEFPDKGAQK